MIEPSPGVSSESQSMGGAWLAVAPQSRFDENSYKRRNHCLTIPRCYSYFAVLTATRTGFHLTAETGPEAGHKTPKEVADGLAL